MTIDRYKVQSFGSEMVLPAEAVSVSPAGTLDFYYQGKMSVSFNSHYWDSCFKILVDQELDTQGDNEELEETVTMLEEQVEELAGIVEGLEY